MAIFPPFHQNMTPLSSDNGSFPLKQENTRRGVPRRPLLEKTWQQIALAFRRNGIDGFDGHHLRLAVYSSIHWEARDCRVGFTNRY